VPVLALVKLPDERPAIPVDREPSVFIKQGGDIDDKEVGTLENLHRRFEAINVSGVIVGISDLLSDDCLIPNEVSQRNLGGSKRAT
jgi:hypothetical protein